VSLRQSIEHTLLNATAKPSEVESLCQEVLNFGLCGACVNPLHVPLARAVLTTRAQVVSVVNFPLGAGSERSDCAEVAWLVEQGATEVDYVIPIGVALSGALDRVTQRVRAVREQCPVVLKVILETSAFEEAQLFDVAQAVMQANPDYLKTSTGFGARGASVEDVRILRRAANGRAAIKASGGIRSYAQARELLDAGATRLGTSRGVNLLQEEQRAAQAAAEQ
jgi:deoxyribose-phosphate aldolase